MEIVCYGINGMEIFFSSSKASVGEGDIHM